MRNPAQYFPLAVAADSVESLLQKHRNKSPWIYWLILAGVFTVLLCLPLVHVDVAVSARGMVRPSHDNVILRAAVSGRIARVLVDDNESVAAGEPLIYFDTSELDERMAHLQAQIGRHAFLRADLVSLLRECSLMALGDSEDSSEDFTRVKVITPGEDQAVQTPYLRAEIEQFRAQLSASGATVNKARGQQARFDALAVRGLVTKQEHENARLETTRLSAEATLIVEKAMTNWQAQLREEEDALARLRSEKRRIQEERQSYLLKSPMDGVVIGFTGWSPGAYAQSGQVFGTISPATNLVVESYVAPRDIGLIEIGQRVRLQIDSFPYTQWGMLNGYVTDVGEDLSSERGAAIPSYKVTIRPEATHLALSTGVNGALRKGMTLVARYRVSSRSLLQIIYEDSSAWINPYQSASLSPL